MPRPTELNPNLSIVKRITSSAKAKTDCGPLDISSPTSKYIDMFPNLPVVKRIASSAKAKTNSGPVAISNLSPREIDMFPNAREVKRIKENAEGMNDIGPLYIVPPLDFSFCNFKSISEALGEAPRSGPVTPKVRSGGTDRKSIKFNNNKLLDLCDLKAVVDHFLLDFRVLCWLDLSFNCLENIEDEILIFPNLQILCLHENKISKLSEVKKLRSLQNLKKLSLYGNPLAKAGYRLSVIVKLPRLEEFDFSRITEGEKSTFQALSKSSRRPTSRIRDVQDDG